MEQILAATDIERTEQLCKPKQSSTIGFLSSNDELEKVLAADNDTLQNLNITHEQVADCIKWLLEKTLRYKAIKGHMDESVTIKFNGKSFEVSYHHYRGSQRCPWIWKHGNCDYKGYGNRDVTVKNLDSGLQIQFPDLIIHLIESHYFFEGSTSYRLNPQDVVDCLEIKPGVSYKIPYKQVKQWQVDQWSTFTEIPSDCTQIMLPETYEDRLKIFIESDGSCLRVSPLNGKVELPNCKIRGYPVGKTWINGNTKFKLDATEFCPCDEDEDISTENNRVSFEFN
jgi:hypothetical protein